DLNFLAPVQQAESALTVDVSNMPETASTSGAVASAWPVLLAIVIWAGGWLAGRGPLRFGAVILGWTIIGWAALRSPNGAPAFLFVAGAFLVLQIGLPALWRLWQAPRLATEEGPSTATGGAPATVALLIAGALWFAPGGGASQASAQTPLAESVTQDIKVEEKYALATAKIRWDASRGEVLPLLLEPAVLTHVTYPTRSLKLEQSFVGNRRAQQLEALLPGTYDIEV